MKIVRGLVLVMSAAFVAAIIVASLSDTPPASPTPTTTTNCILAKVAPPASVVKLHGAPGCAVVYGP